MSDEEADGVDDSLTVEQKRQRWAALRDSLAAQGVDEEGLPGRMTLGSRIRELRERRSLTQRELAARAGTDNTYLSRVETDKADPSIAFIRKLSDVLGVHLADFFVVDNRTNPGGVGRRLIRHRVQFVELRETAEGRRIVLEVLDPDPDKLRLSVGLFGQLQLDPVLTS